MALVGGAGDIGVDLKQPRRAPRKYSMIDQLQTSQQKLARANEGTVRLRRLVIYESDPSALSGENLGNPLSSAALNWWPFSGTISRTFRLRRKPVNVA